MKEQEEGRHGDKHLPPSWWDVLRLGDEVGEARGPDTHLAGASALTEPRDEATAQLNIRWAAAPQSDGANTWQGK